MLSVEPSVAGLHQNDYFVDKESRPSSPTSTVSSLSPSNSRDIADQAVDTDVSHQRFSLDVVFGVNLNTYASAQSRYQFVSRLGNSIYGCVYKAIDTRTQATVAIKFSVMGRMEEVYTTQNARADYDVLENPVLEAQIMKVLTVPTSHPSVLRLVQEFFSNDFKVHWLVMEYAPNGDLFERVEKTGKLSEVETRCLGRQLALGLKHIHDTGVAHLGEFFATLSVCLVCLQPSQFVW